MISCPQCGHDISHHVAILLQVDNYACQECARNLRHCQTTALDIALAEVERLRQPHVPQGYVEVPLDEPLGADERVQLVVTGTAEKGWCPAQDQLVEWNDEDEVHLYVREERP